MSNDGFGENEEFFGQDIAPANIEHLPLGPRTSFYAWHKPRKHWLRVNQWAASIESLVDTLNLGGKNKSLTYLSLPGPDLLDVRTIQPVCKSKEVNLYFLGINNGDDDDDKNKHLNATLLNQVRSMPNIDQASDVVVDKFEHLAKKKSIAYERVINEKQSFDVVNLDLCRSVAEGATGSGPNNFNAIKNLLIHQAASRNDDWILFLTTRTNKDMVDKKTMQLMVSYLNSIKDEEEEFIASLLAYGIVLKTDLADGKIDIEKLNQKSYTNVFSLGVSHWIVHNLLTNNPSWRVNMLPQHAYHVLLSDASCDMLSLGYYCKKIKIPNVPDQIGIAQIPEGPQPEDATLTAKKLSRKVREKVCAGTDVDLMLHNDDAIYGQCLESAVELMKGASYDENAYRVWASEQKEIMTKFMQDIVLPSFDVQVDGKATLE